MHVGPDQIHIKFGPFTKGLSLKPFLRVARFRGNSQCSEEQVVSPTLIILVHTGFYLYIPSRGRCNGSICFN